MEATNSLVLHSTALCSLNSQNFMKCKYLYFSNFSKSHSFIQHCLLKAYHEPHPLYSLLILLIQGCVSNCRAGAYYVRGPGFNLRIPWTPKHCLARTLIWHGSRNIYKYDLLFRDTNAMNNALHKIRTQCIYTELENTKKWSQYHW